MNERLPPVRCWSCNMPLQATWDAYRRRSMEGRETLGAILDSLDVKRYCCRRMLLTQPLSLTLSPPAESGSPGSSEERGGAAVLEVVPEERRG